MKPFSNKRATLERQYHQVVKTKLLEVYEGSTCTYCQGCGYTGMVEPSHRISRGHNITLLAEPENIDFLCRQCHRMVERGAWMELPNKRTALAIDRYIKTTDIIYYNSRKIAKQ